MAQARLVAGLVFIVSQGAQMAACEDSAAWGSPALREDGIRPGDGGIWVTGDGGTWFLPSDPFVRPLRAIPERRTLCMLRGGNLNGESEYEDNSQGTWFGDVPMILGRPDTRTKDRSGAQLNYTYALPEDGADIMKQKVGGDGGMPPTRVSLSLLFERVDAVWPPADARVPMEDPYFLTRIDASGIQPPECWSPSDEGSSAVVPARCDECKLRDRDFFLCEDIVEQIEDCYAR